MEMDWITVVVTALTSGGLVSFGSIWYSRRKAKAETQQIELDVINSVKNIYQELITDLRGSNNEQKAENAMLREKMDDMEGRISRLKEDVEKNARRLAWLIPMTCLVSDCKRRVVYTGEEHGKPKKGMNKRVDKQTS